MSGAQAYNFLLVDDSHTMVNILEKMLRASQHSVGTVHKAYNGEEALAILRDNPVDLVVTDITMPTMTGPEMISSIRNTPATADLPIVVVTSEGSDDRLEQVAKLGVTGFLRKPFSPEQVTNLISMVLGNP